MDILIGLKEESFSDVAENQGLEYVHIPIEDWGGAGDGRTGSALASLKLRECLIKAVHDDPSILEIEPSNTTTVYSFYYKRDIECTPLVKEAIELLREERFSGYVSQSGHHAVESPTDVLSLVSYEQYLRDAMKHTLSAEQGVSTTEAFKAYKTEYTTSTTQEDVKKTKQKADAKEPSGHKLKDSPK
jgi:hypothetical protein